MNRFYNPDLIHTSNEEQSAYTLKRKAHLDLAFTQLTKKACCITEEKIMFTAFAVNIIFTDFAVVSIAV